MNYVCRLAAITLMSGYGRVRQGARRLSAACSVLLEDLSRQLGSGMTCWPPNAANLQHTGSLSNLAAPLRNVKARAQRPFPAQTERHFTAPFSSSRPCAAASSSSSAASSYGSSSPGKRKGEGKTGLRSVAGIGPRNEERLMSKGIDSVDTLWEVFTAQKKRDEDKMLSFLQVLALGLIHERRHKPC